MAIESEKLTSDKAPITSALTVEETREILTPFAFTIDKSLFGTPLASPTRRAVAILIDLIFVALLSDTPGEILALVIAITLYRIGGNKYAAKQGKVRGVKRRKLLRICSFFIVFIVLLDFLPMFFDSELMNNNDQSNKQATLSERNLSTSESITFSVLSAGTIVTVKNSECQSVNCWMHELSPLIKGFATFDLTDKIVDEAVESIVDATTLEKDGQDELSKHLHQAYKSELTRMHEEESLLALETIEHNTINKKAIDQKVKEQKIIDNSQPQNELQQLNTQSPDELIDNDESRPVYSIIEWVKGIIKDLGLGFGWAAFYFTVFSSLWSGQTPGKKIVGIRVLQLDGSPLTIWESFCRYGGYGAGIATGLLGFLQIFWNANRQAIQDQIASTVVIDERKSVKQKRLNKDA